MIRTLSILIVAALIVAAFTSTNLLNDKMKIYYVYDPLCGWCYGFSPVMMKLQRDHSDEFEIEVVSGGMVTGKQIGPMSAEKRRYIKNAYKRVEQMTGVKFGEGYVNGTLESETCIQTSEIPSIALEVFRAKHPERSLEFAHAIQHAIFSDGMQPAVLENYKPLAEKFGMDGNEFIALMSDSNHINKASEQFLLASRWGVQGFPAVLVLHNDSLYMIANGYTSFENLLGSIEQVKKQ